MTRKIKLTRANKSILLKALAPYYYQEKALAYYDKEMLKLWNQQQKVNKKNYSGFSSYVYVRSLFPGVKLPSGNDKMMKKALSAMTKDWKGLPMGET